MSFVSGRWSISSDWPSFGTFAVDDICISYKQHNIINTMMMMALMIGDIYPNHH